MPKPLIIWIFFFASSVSANPVGNHHGIHGSVTDHIHGKENAKFCAHGKHQLMQEHHSEESTETEASFLGEFVEGDIKRNRLVSELRQSLTQRDVIIGDEYTWHFSEIPYQFSNNAGNLIKEVVQSAIADFEKYTCIRFIQHTDESDYIKFTDEQPGCWSYVGRMGGMQEVNLGSGCYFKGTAIHETMHALGFFHEHTRLDRDEFIKINFENIIADKADNFKKYPNGMADYYGEAYDFSSIMHYRDTAFTKNGRKTIEPLDKAIKSADMGQRDGFSDIDLKQLNKAFKCSEIRPSKPPSTTSSRSSPSPQLPLIPKPTSMPSTKPTQTLTTKTTVASKLKPPVNPSPPIVGLKTTVKPLAPYPSVPTATTKIFTLQSTSTPRSYSPKPLTTTVFKAQTTPAKVTRTKFTGIAKSHTKISGLGTPMFITTPKVSKGYPLPTKVPLIMNNKNANEYPNWPHGYVWSSSYTNQYGQSCTKICYRIPIGQINEKKDCLCHTNTTKKPEFFLSNESNHLHADCVKVPSTLLSKDFLCYSKNTGYKLYIKEAKSMDNQQKQANCIVLPASRLNDDLYLCS